MKFRSLAVSFVTAALALAGAAKPAAACSPLPCWPGAFVPGNGAQVPANVPGLVWRPLSDLSAQTAPDPTNVTLKADGEAAIALTATSQQDGTFVLAPATALTPGKTYVLHDATACSFGAEFATPDATFTAIASAPLPASLGATTSTTAVRQSVQLATASGSCSVDADVDAVSLELSVASDALPWKDVLMFATKVDGAAWGASGSINGQVDPGASWTGRGKDRVFEVCGGGDTLSSSGLPGGAHEATFHATLPGTALAFDASPVSFQLACGTQAAETLDNFPPEHHSGGCLSASPSTPGFAAIALLAGLIVPRRRRRRTLRTI